MCRRVESAVTKVPAVEEAGPGVLLGQVERREGGGGHEKSVCERNGAAHGARDLVCVEMRVERERDVVRTPSRLGWYVYMAHAERRSL